MKKHITKIQNFINTYSLSSVLGKRRLNDSDEQTNKRFKKNDNNEGSELCTGKWLGFDTTDHTNSANPSNHESESDENSSSDKSEFSDNKSNNIYVGNNIVNTINIKQKSKKDNFIIIHTDPDTTKINIKQDSGKNNYLIIDPFDAKNYNKPVNDHSVNYNKPTTINNYRYEYNNSTHNDNTTINSYNYNNSTHKGESGAIGISYPKNVNLTGTHYVQSSITEHKPNEAPTELKEKLPDNTKNDSKIEPKYDNSKSGGSALSGSGFISGGDTGNESNSAGPYNFN